MVDMSVSCSPSQATEKDNIQRISKDLYNKVTVLLVSGTIIAPVP